MNRLYAALGGDLIQGKKPTNMPKWMTLSDGTNAYAFTLPRIKYNSGQPDVSGEGEVTISLDIMALFDETEESQIVITKGAA